jgi:hypothetical protein
MENRAFVRGSSSQDGKRIPNIDDVPTSSDAEPHHSSVAVAIRAAIHIANQKHIVVASKNCGNGLKLQGLAARFCEGAAADRQASKRLSLHARRK